MSSPSPRSYGERVGVRGFFPQLPTDEMSARSLPLTRIAKSDPTSPRKRGEVKMAAPQFTSICKPSCLMMAANFAVSAWTKSENCCGVP